jgi:hypothetical protein
MAYAEKRGNLWRARWRGPDGTLESKAHGHPRSEYRANRTAGTLAGDRRRVRAAASGGEEVAAPPSGRAVPVEAASPVLARPGPCRPRADLLRQGAELIGFCSWREGLALRPELATGIAGVADLHRAGLRVVNRSPAPMRGSCSTTSSPVTASTRASWPGTRRRRPGTCRWPPRSRPGSRARELRADRPRWPMTWRSCRWPASVSTR